MDYKKLEQDLIKAKNAGVEAAKGEDGGTANMDSVFLCLPKTREIKVLEAIKNAGLYCRKKTKWIGVGYMISPVKCGQGNSRARAQKAMLDSLESDSYKVLGFYKMD